MRLSELLKQATAKRTMTSAVSYLLSDPPLAKATFKKYKRYVESWKPTTFTPQELKFLRGLPGVKSVTFAVLYHGKNVPLSTLVTYPKGKQLVYKPTAQFSSWTTKKNRVEYFQRGPGMGIVLKAATPKEAKTFNVNSLMHDVLDPLDEWYDDHLYSNVYKKAELALIGYLTDITLYDEGEVWVFGPIKATVLSVG